MKGVHVKGFFVLFVKLFCRSDFKIKCLKKKCGQFDHQLGQPENCQPSRLSAAGTTPCAPPFPLTLPSLGI